MGARSGRFIQGVREPADPTTDGKARRGRSLKIGKRTFVGKQEKGAEGATVINVDLNIRKTEKMV